MFSLDLDKKRVVRVLAFGDFGDGSPRQEHVAEAMRRLHHDKPFDLALTLGDNDQQVKIAEKQNLIVAIERLGGNEIAFGRA